MDCFKLTAPCGLDCFNCEIYEGNAAPEMLHALAAQLGRTPEEVACKGCRQQNGCSVHPECATLKCVRSKNVDFCYQCGDFPCEKLTPSAQGAERYPHNYKLYNLCRIQKSGLTNWAENEATDIRRRYFKGQFIVGLGPVLK